MEVTCVGPMGERSHVVAEDGHALVGHTPVHEEEATQEAELADGEVGVVDSLRLPCDCYVITM